MDEDRGRTDPGADTDGEDDDRTRIVRDLYDRIPYHRTHGIEVLVVTPRRAETKFPYEESLIGNPDLKVLHGGVISSLVDLTGAAVFIGEREDYTPTVDLRVDYLSAAGKRPLYANARIEREGGNIGVASVEVESGDEVCATGTGVYKLSHE
ncbi:MAG: PaaI family thioesterase [Haloarculaceae archaeon]